MREGGPFRASGRSPPLEAMQFFFLFPLTFCINSFCVCGWMRKVKDGGRGGRGARVVMEEG